MCDLLCVTGSRTSDEILSEHMSDRDKSKNAYTEPRRRSKTPRRASEPRASTSKPATAVVREPVPPDAGSEKLAKICGQAAVTALFRKDAGRAVRLYYAEGMKTAAGPFCSRMAEMRRIYRLVSEEELARIAGTVHHGGMVAAAQPRAVLPFDSDMADRWAQAGAPLVVLDGVANPHNLGAVARTLAFFGLPRLLISGHHAQAGLSDAAYRIAEGGLEYLDIYEAEHLSQTLKDIRDSYRVVGTVLRGGCSLGALPPDPRPICLVLGNEQQGLPEATLRACEELVTLRGSGAVQSLNVSATAAILIWQIASRARIVEKKPHEPGRRRRPARRSTR